MDSLNIERQKLLLELARDIIQNTNPGYDDTSIDIKIDKYIKLVTKAKAGSKLDYNEQEELLKLHKFFYGTEFNLDKPLETDNSISTNIYEEFRTIYSTIEKLVTETDSINEKLIESLSKILTNIDDLKDDKKINEYLNLIYYNIQKYKKLPISSSANTITHRKQTNELANDIKQKITENETKAQQKITENEANKQTLKEKIKAEKDRKKQEKKERDDKADEALKELKIKLQNKSSSTSSDDISDAKPEKKTESSHDKSDAKPEKKNQLSDLITEYQSKINKRTEENYKALKRPKEQIINSAVINESVSQAFATQAFKKQASVSQASENQLSVIQTTESQESKKQEIDMSILQKKYLIKHYFEIINQTEIKDYIDLIKNKLIKLLNIKEQSTTEDIKNNCLELIDQALSNEENKKLINYKVFYLELLKIKNLINNNIYEIPENVDDYYYINYLIYQKSKHMTNLKIGSFLDEINKSNISKSKITEKKPGFFNRIFKRKGGNKKENPIKIEKVFKLFYNFVGNEKIEDINSIYKLYFLLNIYGIYSTNKELLLKLIEIIDNDKYTEEIYKLIETLLNDILIITKQIFKDYINVFNETDKIIKNYYLNYQQLIKYLHINLLYDIYKNLEETNINLNFIINNVSLNINKTNKEIKDEIIEMFNKDDFIFGNDNIIIKNQVVNNDIIYLMEVIYFLTNNSEIILDNMNDVNIYIIMELLSNEGNIEISINNKLYKLPNINHKPYKFSDITPIIKLNKNQIELYEYLLIPQNYNKLFEILKKDFYFIDFNIDKFYNYKFNINNEILNLVNINKIENKPLIKYPNSLISFDIKMLSILQIKANTYLSLINYGLYLTAGIFIKSSTYNFMSLLYIYLILKNSSFNFTNDYDYIIPFFEKVLFTMRKFLVIKYDIDNFIKIIINFKNTNTYLKDFIETIKIDTTFLKTLYRFNDDSTIEDIVNYYIKSLQTSFIYLIDNCNNFKELDILINTYFIPIISGLKDSKRNIEDLQKMIIDLKAKSLKLQLIPEEIKGGNNITLPNISNQIKNINEDKSKTQFGITEQEKDELTNKLLYINKFIKDYKDFNEKNKFDLDTESGFIYTFNKFLTANEPNKEKLKNVDPTDEFSFNKEITTIKLDVNEKLVKIKREREYYSKNIKDADKGEIEKKIIDFETKLKNIKDNIIPFLEKYKSINNQDIKNILGIILKKDEDDADNLFEIIESQLKLYNKVIEKYKKELEFNENGLNDMLKTIKDLENKYDLLINARAKETKAEKDFRRQQEKEAREKEAREKQEKEKEPKLVGGDFKDLAKDFENLKNKDIGNKITKLEGNIKKLKTNIKTNESNEINNEIKELNENKLNIFERILNKYEEDTKTSIPEIASAKLYERVVENNLDPAIELEITLMDKIIFIISVIILRIISLQICNYFIDRDRITTIQQSIKYYTIAYLIIFLILFMIINIDIFRLRIIFNYMNMHSNSTGILIHLIIKIIIGYIVYLLIINIDTSSKPTRLSKHQKIKLKNKLDILTIAILVFIIVFILVI